VNDLLRDPRVRRLLLANLTGSVGCGVTMIAVPWLLIQQPDGTRFYGYATLGTTIALFLFMPYYGAWLDRRSRRSILLAGELFGGVAMIAMAAWAWVAGGLSTAQLMTTYFCGMLYSTLHFPAKFAFVQELFQRRHYASLTGLLEIQGQFATVIAGGLASLLIGTVSLPWLLCADAATYFLSFAVQRGLPPPARRPPPRVHRSAWHAMAEGGRWLCERPRLCVFLLSTYVPFVVVMAGQYLFPIYVDRVLQASSGVYGGGEMMFAAGAMLAGVLIPRLVPKHGADRTMVVTMGLFFSGLVLLIVLRATPLYYVSLLLLGLGTAGSRVARSTIVLTRVPGEVLGRVQMFFSAFDRLLRTSLILAATMIVVRSGPANGFVLLAAVVAGAFAAMLFSRASIRREEQAEPALVSST